MRVKFEKIQFWFRDTLAEWVFDLKCLCFGFPIQSHTETIRSNKTHGTRLFIPSLNYNCYDEKFHLVWSTLRNFPVVTQQGHFIIDGVYHICSTTRLRCLGARRGGELNFFGKAVFHINFISNKEKWVRLEKDFKNLIWFCINAKPRRIVTRILYNIGWLLKKKIACKPADKDDKLVATHLGLFTQILNGGNILKLSLRSFHRSQTREILCLVYLFSNSRKYDVGEVGRKSMNERFDQVFPTSIRCLAPTDFINAIVELDQLSVRKMKRRFDDFDDLKIHRLRAVGNLLRRELKTAISQVGCDIFQRLNFFNNEKRQINSAASDFIVLMTPFDRGFYQFITTNPLPLFTGHLNFFSKVTQRRRVTGLGTGGLNVSTRTDKIRATHASNFGRLCFLDTPDSETAGMRASQTISLRLSNDDFIQFVVIVGQNSSPTSISDGIVLALLIFLWAT